MKNRIICLFALLAFSAVAAEKDIIFYSSLDSAADIAAPAVGPAGQDHGATFVSGKFSQALYVPAHSNVAEFPFENGFPEVCTIDFWVKLESPREYFTDGADPYLFMIAKGYAGVPDIVFEVNFNSNNGCGQCGLFCGMTYGRALIINKGRKFADYLGSNTKDWHRYTVRWNCAGLDGTANIMQLLLDGNILGTGMSDPKQVESFRKSLKQPLKLIFSNLDSGHGKSAIQIDEVKVYATDRHIETVIGKDVRIPKKVRAPKKPRVVALKESADSLRQKRLAAAKAAAAAAAKGREIDSIPDWATGTFVGGGDEGSALFIVDKSGMLAGRWTTAEKVWKMTAYAFGACDEANEVCAAEVTFESDGEKMTKKILVVTPTSAKCEGFEAWACEWYVNPVWKAVAEKLSGKAAEFEEQGTNVYLEIKDAGTARVTLSKKGIVRTCESTLVPDETDAARFHIFVAIPADSKDFRGFVSEFVLNGESL